MATSRADFGFRGIRSRPAFAIGARLFATLPSGLLVRGALLPAPDRLGWDRIVAAAALGVALLSGWMD